MNKKNQNGGWLWKQGNMSTIQHSWSNLASQMSSDEEDYADDYEDDNYSSDIDDEPENDNVRKMSWFL